MRVGIFIDSFVTRMVTATGLQKMTAVYVKLRAYKTKEPTKMRSGSVTLESSQLELWQEYSVTPQPQLPCRVGLTVQRTTLVQLTANCITIASSAIPCLGNLLGLVMPRHNAMIPVTNIDQWISCWSVLLAVHNGFCRIIGPISDRIVYVPVVLI